MKLPALWAYHGLNETLLEKCLKYRKHKIKGRDLNVGQMVEIEKPKLIALPKYAFDTSRSLIAVVDEFSTIRFDHNTYSVPFKYVGKDVSVKGYGNDIKVLYRNLEIAAYSCCYTRGEVKYQVEHYIDLIEQRPRSVYNAKPVKQNLHPELMELGKRLSSPREMVKLLRLCIEYGQDRVLMAAKEIIFTEPLTMALLTAYMTPHGKITPLSMPGEIKVRNTGLSKYDGLLKSEMVV